MNKPLSSATASRRLNADLERLESGALVCTLSTGLSFDGPLREFFAAQPDRYEDLVSNTIVQVLPQLGWSFAGVPVCATLRDDGGKVCATGWAARTSFGSEGGVNLSYAVAPRWEGRGLGRYAVARALLCLDQLTARLHPAVEVHAQSLSTNSAAHAVARGSRAERRPAPECDLPREIRGTDSGTRLSRKQCDVGIDPRARALHCRSVPSAAAGVR
jgi:GNAT superfamily N-acetyltransferase